jgi:hypothetical protein
MNETQIEPVKCQRLRTIEGTLQRDSDMVTAVLISQQLENGRYSRPPKDGEVNHDHATGVHFLQLEHCQNVQ